MRKSLITTEIKSDNFFGLYPKALETASYILVKERNNFVPIYAPRGFMNSIERTVKEAEFSNSSNIGIIRLNASKEIEILKGKIKNMVYGIRDWVSSSTYLNGIILSEDLNSENPSIIKPENTEYDFQFNLKKFNIGLSGRILKNSIGETFEEEIILTPTIFDLYALAIALSPERISAVDSHGIEKIIYEKDHSIDEIENSKGDNSKRFYVLYEREIENYRNIFNNPELLPTNGMTPVFSDFYSAISKYKGKCNLFGHSLSNIDEFLDFSCISDNHLFWKICRLAEIERDPNAPLIDCKRKYGIKNEIREFPENINRLQLVPDNAFISCVNFSLKFDQASAIQSLMNLGEIVRDIWFDPLYSESESSEWVIIYDKSRNITPDNPVHLSISEIKNYQVLKF
jgi:hypothetical protein